MRSHQKMRDRGYLDFQDFLMAKPSAEETDAADRELEFH